MSFFIWPLQWWTLGSATSHLCGISIQNDMMQFGTERGKPQNGQIILSWISYNITKLIWMVEMFSLNAATTYGKIVCWKFPSVVCFYIHVNHKITSVLLRYNFFLFSKSSYTKLWSWKFLTHLPLKKKKKKFLFSYGAQVKP